MAEAAGVKEYTWHCDRHASASRVGKAGVGSHSTPWLQCHCTIQFAKVAELPDAPGFRSAFLPKLYRGARERKLTQSQGPPFTAKGKKVTGSGKADRIRLSNAPCSCFAFSVALEQ